jgi:hypothetical protein
MQQIRNILMVPAFALSLLGCLVDDETPVAEATDDGELQEIRDDSDHPPAQEVQSASSEPLSLKDSVRQMEASRSDAATRAAPPAIPSHERRVIELEQEGEQPIGVLSPAWTCSSGYACYFDGLNGVEGPRPTFGARSCGDYNLGARTPPQNDMASSVWNRRSTWNHLYNWDGVSRWIYLGSIAPGAKGNLSASINNIVDGVIVDCP